MKPSPHQRYSYVGPKRMEELLPTYWELNMVDFIRKKAFENHSEKEGDIILRSLPIMVRLIFTIYWLDSEVQNGSYDQYFHNSSGDFKDLVVEDLEFLGATKIAIITGNAINSFKMYEDGNYTEDIYDSLIDKYTDEYHEAYIEENLQEMLQNFIQKNLEYFKNIED